MKQLIFDKLTRLAVYWIILGLAGLVLEFEILDFQSPCFVILIIYFVFYLLGFSNSFTELRSGYGRIVLTLPFTTRQIGRGLWLVSVGLPTLAITIGSGIVILISALGTSAFEESLVLWLHLGLMSGLIFASSFWLLNPRPKASINKHRIQFAYHIVFYAVLAGIGYELYQASFSPEIKYIIVCLLMLPFALLSWHRAESLLVDYGECRQLASTGATSSGKYQPPAGFGGLRLLFVNQAGQFLTIMAGILIFVCLYFHWSSSQPVQPEMWTVFPLICGLSVLLAIDGICAHQKFLRTLPISSKQLAGVFLLLATGPYALISVLTGLWLTWSQGFTAGTWIFYTSAFVMASIGCLTIAFVRYSEDSMETVAFAVLVLVLPAVIPIFLLASWGINLPLAFVILYPLAFLIGSFFAIAHFIETNDLAYRRRDTPDAWAANQ